VTQNNVENYSFFCLFFQFKSSECISEGLPTTTSYSALIKAAYIQGPSTLLKDTFRENVKERLASMSLAEFPVALKQILLYIKSTVENFGTVRAQSKLVIH